MTADLFGSDFGERIPARGANLVLFRQVALPFSAAALLADLKENTPWQQESIVVWGKRHLQPRLISWYGDPGKSYHYSGIKLDPHPWTDTLASVRNVVEALAGSKFNSVLLNYYRDGNDSMGFHSDDERELGPSPTIASLSLGAERVFVLKPKHEALGEAIRIPLPHGSLLVMRDETQRNWVHGIAKLARPTGPRINLTFRHIF